MRTRNRLRGALGLLVAMLVVPAGASAAPFPARIGKALGIAPVAGRSVDPAAGEALPEVYHGGPVMTGPVTVHTVFWAPPGYAFSGSPAPGVPGYTALIQRFYSDAAAAAGSTTNVFSVLSQYGGSNGAGSYGIVYSPGADSVLDADPYPKRADQCASPYGLSTCVTDTQVGTELSALISRSDPTGRGLHDLWLVYLPPGVDECTATSACGTNAFGGYHSVTDRGRGAVIYAVIPDPLIEYPIPPGSDPNGNPDAEQAIDVSGHETVEAITDPLGTGWLDPNGYEIADKCENGPALGTPLGFAPNGAPYDQVINGDRYLLQEMWSNAAHGCVQRDSTTAGRGSLPLVVLRQFSAQVRGNIGTARGGVPVRVTLLRALTPVAIANAVTRADGSWGPVTAVGIRGGVSGAFGDDRDAIAVAYGRGGPPPDLIGTGSGGNPFTEAGFTGWFDLDNGAVVGSRAVVISPCGQVGSLTVAGVAYTGSPEALCNGETDTAVLRSARPLSAGSALTLTSVDNRASSVLNPAGALVSLTVPVGEPGSVSLGAPFTSAKGAPRTQPVLSTLTFLPGGFPACTADLRAQSVTCSGLVPGARYRLTGLGRARAATARPDGSAAFPASGLRGGDRLTLRNREGRRLTTLHVAHLRVALDGTQTVLAGGTCQPGEYYGRPLRTAPVSSGVGNGGATGTGTICPLGGRAKGLPAVAIEQTDPLSGGITRTEVPELTGTAPSDDATVYGAFTALAQAGLPGPHGSTVGLGTPVSVTITPAGASRVLFHAADVNTRSGAAVPPLPTGVYTATWVLRDVAGDTRTVRTRFVEAG
jgi:hypothetical protein